jgi:hypothetical protein
MNFVAETFLLQLMNVAANYQREASATDLYFLLP